MPGLTIVVNWCFTSRGHPAQPEEIKMAGSTICSNCGKPLGEHTVEELAACRAAQN